MEGVLTAQLAPQGRPGWWRTGWVLAFGVLLGSCLLTAAALLLAAVAGVVPGREGPDHGWPFPPVEAASLAADLGFMLFALALLTVVTRGVLGAWLEVQMAPTWVALALGLGGFGAFVVGPLASGGSSGFLIALLVVRYGAFDFQGRPRGGVLALVGGRARTRARLVTRLLPLVGVALACAYGVTHPVGVPRGSTATPQGLAVKHAPVAAREFHVILEPRGLGDVDVLAVRAPRRGTRVLAAGAPSGVMWGPPGGLPRPAETLHVWLSAPRCPARTLTVDRLDVRARSWSGTRWVPVRIAPAWRVRCIR